MSALPAAIADEIHLDALLSEPTERVVKAMARVDGDIIVLGVGGKMGPTLARMARRAADLAGGPRRVIGVSRFTTSSKEAALHAHGVETIRCDLLDEAAVGRLPTAPNVIFMAGRKFGSTGAESLTWAMNCLVPSAVCRHFEASRIVAFSTGNVYGLTGVGAGGSRETDLPQPVGEYAMSCLGRERVFEHFSQTRGTRVAILRLNYAVEMRYGILVDLVQHLLAGETVDLAMGYVNVIWQADANAMALCALAHAASPPLVVNVAGPEELSVRQAAEALARALGRPVTFTGVESPDALLSNGALGWSLLGPPRVDVARLIDWTADWLAHGRATSGKPTHFESRAGRF
ncbi:MAG: NAD(P)-dependent oxidoreductase [Vicinamibacteria bacterium]|nr:NAD(P)-dependent oxidoreductase [Vicinamibacteria bacterium]